MASPPTSRRRRASISRLSRRVSRSELAVSLVVSAVLVCLHLPWQLHVLVAVVIALLFRL